MKLLKNKTVIGLIAIIVGILTCFIFTPIYNKSLEAKTKIVSVVKDIKKGEVITKDEIKEIKVGSFHLPDTIIKDKEVVIGKYAMTDLYQGDFLMKNKISNKSLSQDRYLENLDGSTGAISVSLKSFADGLSGKLLGGDIVSIITTDKNNGTSDIPNELKYVKVLACTTSAGKDVDENTRSDKEDDENKIASTVTLLVNDQQARMLANMEATQDIHIELVYRGSEENCNKLLKQQKEVIAQDNEGSDQQEDNTQSKTKER